MWVGTLTSGLIKFDPIRETYTQFKYNPSDFNSVSSNYVWDVYNDSNEKLFLSTERGVDIFDLKSEKIVKHLDIPIDLSGGLLKTFRQVIKDHLGNIWACLLYTSNIRYSIAD